MRKFQCVAHIDVAFTGSTTQNNTDVVESTMLNFVHRCLTWKDPSRKYSPTSQWAKEALPLLRANFSSDIYLFSPLRSPMEPSESRPRSAFRLLTIRPHRALHRDTLLSVLSVFHCFTNAVQGMFYTFVLSLLHLE